MSSFTLMKLGGVRYIWKLKYSYIWIYEYFIIPIKYYPGFRNDQSRSTKSHVVLISNTRSSHTVAVTHILALSHFGRPQSWRFFSVFFIYLFFLNRTFESNLFPFILFSWFHLLLCKTNFVNELGAVSIYSIYTTYI